MVINPEYLLIFIDGVWILYKNYKKRTTAAVRTMIFSFFVNGTLNSITINTIFSIVHRILL